MGGTVEVCRLHKKRNCFTPSWQMPIGDKNCSLCYGNDRRWNKLIDVLLFFKMRDLNTLKSFGVKVRESIERKRWVFSNGC